MSDMIYPSDLICQGAGISKSSIDSVQAEFDGRCGMCGKPHKAGDKVDPMVIQKTFTVEHAIDDPHAPYLSLIHI